MRQLVDGTAGNVRLIQLGDEPLMYKFVEVGRAQNLERLIGYVFLENHVMRHLCRKLGFTMNYSVSVGAIEAAISLRRYPRSFA
jgi:hypothetical protein